MRRSAAVYASVVLLTLSAAAGATDYKLNYAFQGTSATNLNVSFYDTGNHLTTEGAGSGRFVASWDPSNVRPPGFANLNNFDVYCVDVDHWTASPSTVNVLPVNAANSANIVPVDFYTRLQKIGWLYDNYAGAAHTDIIQSSALQSAIWNVLQDTDYSVTTAGGNARGSYFKIAAYNGSTDFTDIVTDANAMLASLENAVNHGNGIGNGTYFKVDRQLPNPPLDPTVNYQDMFGPAVAPEGESIVLILAGLLPCAWLIRRRNSRKPEA